MKSFSSPDSITGRMGPISLQASLKSDHLGIEESENVSFCNRIILQKMGLSIGFHSVALLMPFRQFKCFLEFFRWSARSLGSD